MKKIALFTFLILFSSSAFSYGAISGKVKSVRIDRNGNGMVQFYGDVGHEPASCRSDAYKSYLSFDTKTEGGRAIYSMMLAAAASGKSVIAYGTKACNDYPNIVESLSYAHYVSD
jgi:hypothetical protein